MGHIGEIHGDRWGVGEFVWHVFCLPLHPSPTFLFPLLEWTVRGVACSGRIVCALTSKSQQPALYTPAAPKATDYRLAHELLALPRMSALLAQPLNSLRSAIAAAHTSVLASVQPAEEALASRFFFPTHRPLCCSARLRPLSCPGTSRFLS